MIKHLCSLLAPALAVGCTDSSSDDKGSYAPDPGVALTLSFDGLEVATGSCTGVTEVQTPASDPTCVAAVELYDGSCWGIFSSRPTFASLEVGVASELLDPLLLVWSGTNPEANWDQSTDQWRGTLEIVEWGEERRVLDLVEGERCAIGDAESCAATTGTLVIEGPRGGSYTAEAPGSEPAWRDLSSGDLLCSSDLP